MPVVAAHAKTPSAVPMPQKSVPSNGKSVDQSAHEASLQEKREAQQRCENYALIDKFLGECQGIQMNAHVHHTRSKRFSPQQNENERSEWRKTADHILSIDRRMPTPRVESNSFYVAANRIMMSNYSRANSVGAPEDPQLFRSAGGVVPRKRQPKPAAKPAVVASASSASAASSASPASSASSCLLYTSPSPRDRG